MAANCCNCGQRIVGRGFTIEGKTYCGACYSLLIEKRKEREDSISKVIDLLTQISSYWSLSSAQLTRQIGLLIDLYSEEYVLGIIKYYYIILGNSADYRDLFDFYNFIQSLSDQYEKYLKEQEEIRKINESINLDVPSQTIQIHKKTKKTKPKQIKYNMEDL